MRNAHRLTSAGFEYTLNIKTELPSRRPDGRDTSTVEYAGTFRGSGSVELPWSSFRASYRGKPSPDAPPLDTGHIVRWSIMARSFFDRQHGEFAMELGRVSAYE